MTEANCNNCEYFRKYKTRRKYKGMCKEYSHYVEDCENPECNGSRYVANIDELKRISKRLYDELCRCMAFNQVPEHDSVINLGNELGSITASIDNARMRIEYPKYRRRNTGIVEAFKVGTMVSNEMFPDFVKDVFEGMSDDGKFLYDDPRYGCRPLTAGAWIVHESGNTFTMTNEDFERIYEVYDGE